MFETASRLKIRFESQKGPLSVEDLWDLPLTSTTNKPNLDDIARSVNRQLKSEGDDTSFVTSSTKSDKTVQLQLKLDILKHVIGVKMAEREVQRKAEANKAQRQRILEIINAKQDSALQNQSIEELQAILASMGPVVS